MGKLRAGNVGRVSKDKSGEARSVDEQHAENAAAAAANGWAVTEEYEDVMSASRFARGAREDWPRLVADVDGGKLDVVLLWEPSRGSRKLGEWITFLDLCRERGVLIHVTSHRHTYDQASWRDRKSLVEDGTDAEGESEKTSERVKRALAANAADGMPHSPAPYGYRRCYDDRGHLSRDQAQAPVAEEAAVVRQVIGLVAAGQPLSQIERGTGVKRSTIRKWCYSPAYAGKVRTPGGLVPARWPAIVDEGTWRGAQAVLAGKPRAGANSRPGGARYLLSGIMGCCACPLLVEADPDSTRRRALYACRTGHVTIAQAGADEATRDVVLALVLREDVREFLAAAAGDDGVKAAADVARLEAELDEWLSAGISPRAYKAKEDEYLPLIAAAKEHAARVTVPAPVRELVTAGPGALSVWKSYTVAQKRGAVRFLFESVTLQRSPRPGPGVPAHERITWEWRKFG